MEEVQEADREIEVHNFVCPFCDDGTAKVEIAHNKTVFCRCEDCGEEFIPSWMLDYNAEIIKQNRKLK